MLGPLFKKYMHLVYGVCLKYLKNSEDAKDAVMQIFEKLIATLKDQEIEKFDSWLYVTSRNHCLMQLRSTKRKVDFKEGVFMENQYFLHHNNEENLEQDLELLKKGIQTLNKEQKSCITLFYLEKKSYQEISDSTGYNLQKVKSYLQNGKRNLKIFMENKRGKANSS